MPLSETRLGNKMADAVIALTSPAPIGEDVTELRTLMKALAKEIIDEFIANAIVVTAVPGISTGPSSAVGTGGITA